MPRKAVAVITLVLALAALAGCGGAPRDPAMNIVLIPPAELPPGWALIPSSEMPLYPQTPWMHENPQVVDCKTLEDSKFLGPKSKATRMWVAMYRKHDNYSVSIYAASFDNPQDLERARQVVPGMGFHGCLIGFAKHAPNTLAFLAGNHESPELQWAVERFESLVDVKMPEVPPKDVDPEVHVKDVDKGGGGR